MTEREQFAQDNGMSMDFVNWFFDHKKDGCGNVWFMMAAAMWEGWKGLASQEAKPLHVTDGMALDFHHALTDGSIGNDELEEIKVGLRAALCNIIAPPASAGEVVVTRNERGVIVAVTRQDGEGRVVEVIAESNEPPASAVPDDVSYSALEATSQDREVVEAIWNTYRSAILAQPLNGHFTLAQAIPGAIITAPIEAMRCGPAASYVMGWNAYRTAILAQLVSISYMLTIDTRRMDWLVAHHVSVRKPLRYGSEAMFTAQTITDEEDDYHATKLREQIDAAMKAEAAKMRL